MPYFVILKRSNRVETQFISDNISILVLDIFKEFVNNSGKEISGLSITINGFDTDGNVNEDASIRNKMDYALEQNNKQSITTVANTIFPVNLWNPDYDRQTLYKRYRNIFKNIKKCPLNKDGIYFERIINFSDGLNQLDEIIKFYESGRRRRSAFQIAVWDPKRDLKNLPYSIFPCLQHLVFSCVKDQIIVIAFYATQYIFARAYGNFLGICNLGKFFSHELGIPLKEVKFYIGVELLDIPKTDLREVVDSI